MGILFDHNQKAYEAAVSMLEGTGRAAIIHPTGTGKSFLAFQLCADRADRKVCWLSPSEYIFKTQLEKWGAAGGRKLKNIEFITYARLMRMGEEGLWKIQPDYIVLDEFHRCGAAQWGGGVKRLREMYPEAKVLGLSATNIRYLDNQRDMAWELFGGNVASELTLGAAVVQGILPAPKYVLSVYSYQKELKRYQMRVRQARNKAVREQAEKELEALRRALEKADGLAEVFERHMVGEGHLARDGQECRHPGKYIVFCANYGHLCKMRELAPEWFAKVDPAPHIYTAYADDPETSSEFAVFKADTSGHLKLLYCIDMLNEGIHVDGLDGVILLRPTVSPTIYKQQIGRALAAGGKKTPVIFDIVMNIENLCSIGAVEEELRSAVLFCRANGREDQIVQEHFRVIDELGDCRRLFAQLNETLSASWDAMYAMAKEYYAEHGNLAIPAKYTTADGYSLGAWVATQRKVYLGKVAGNLSGEQIRKLTAIGMCWQGTQEASWEHNFAEAEKYFKGHGDLEVPADYVTEDGCRLGRWVRRQRELYQKIADVGQGDAAVTGALGMNKKLSMRENRSVNLERVRRLTRIGMVWEKDDPWERRFALAKEYYKEHGNLRMAADYVVDGVWLDRWLREQKARWEAELGTGNDGNGEDAEDGSRVEGEQNVRRAGGIPCNRAEGIPETVHKVQDVREPRRLLTQEQKEKLSSIGLVPGVSQAELSWREQYGEAEKFYRQNGNLIIPKRYTADHGKNLRVWLSHQRTNRREGRLAGWQVGMLDGIGMVWESPDAWEIGFAHAEEYFSEQGNLEVPNAYLCADGYRLGKWISNQRCAYRGIAKKGLTTEQIKRLDGIGMVWNAGQGRRAITSLKAAKYNNNL